MKKSIKREKKMDSSVVTNLNATNTIVDIVDIVDNFKHNGISVLDNLSVEQLSVVLTESNKAYYNQQPFMTDHEYDIIKEYVQQKYPTNALISTIIHEVGAPPLPIERNKVTLPYPMGSMDKIKPNTNALSTWMQKYKGPYLVSCKLDGVSGLYTTEGKEPKLYTRGNGIIGQDISHLIPHLRLPIQPEIVIRGEFIIPKKTFTTKYTKQFSNSRNMVSGIINQKSISESVKDIRFVAYEVIQPPMIPSKQIEFIQTLSIESVQSQLVPMQQLTNELLSETLVHWRSNYLYEIDGIVVTNNALYERKIGNPDHAFAFKMVLSDQVAEAKVVDVVWTPSKDGYLKPRVQIEPIQLGGVCIEFATGFNAAFIYDNKIGVGTIIELIRSGDVIPHIRKVVVSSDKPKMPNVSYQWNSSHVDIMLENVDSDKTVREKNITGFFRTIGVEGFSSGNVSRIMKSGFDTVAKIIQMTVDDLEKIDGFQHKTATKIHDGIRDKMKQATIIQLMTGSNMFGRGFSDKKLELIMESYSDVLISNESVNVKVLKVENIKGMANKTAQGFVEKIPEFIRFMKEIGLEHMLYSCSNSVGAEKKDDVNKTHPLYGKTIVMTGFRDATLQHTLQHKFGVKIGTSVSKNTFLLLVKDKDKDSNAPVTGKLLEAQQLGVTIMSRDDFVHTYLFMDHGLI
jgi:NAD-dependent DNA ligase